jgi:hypothetical protein
VLFIELYRPLPRFVVAFGEDGQGWLGKNLGAAEEFFGAALRCLALYVGHSVFEMKDEPELKTGIRDGQVDAVPGRESDSLVEVGMLVSVEDAPDLVVGPSSPFLRVASFDPLSLDGSLDELHGGASIGVDFDQDSVAVLAAPVCEVQVLGTKALDKHEQIEQNRGP